MMKIKDLMQMSSVQLVMFAQDNQIRIEELEKENAELRLIITTDTGTESAVAALQDKLALAVEALEGACKHIEAPFGARTKCCFREALTKIKGE